VGRFLEVNKINSTMADFDDIPTDGSQNVEKDLVADFLMREQDKLAELDEDFDSFGTSGQKTDFTNEFNATVGYGTVSDSGVPDFDPFTGGSGQSTEYGVTDDHSQDPYSQVKQMDKHRAEPEKIRIWREQQVEMLQQKDVDSEKKKAEWRDIARHELEDWYKHRNEQVEKSKKVNRENEDAFVQQRDERKPGGEWERVCRLCDFNPKGSRNTKDITRMRSILLQLKQTPNER
jgi:clathrin light chain A